MKIPKIFEVSPPSDYLTFTRKLGTIDFKKLAVAFLGPKPNHQQIESRTSTSQINVQQTQKKKNDPPKCSAQGTTAPSGVLCLVLRACFPSTASQVMYLSREFLPGEEVKEEETED